MGRKKNREKAQQGAGPATKSTPAAAQANGNGKKIGASPKVIVAMGIAGAFLGFLSGINQWPPQPANLLTPEAGAAWLGGILGLQHLDWNAAFQGGFLGLAVGLGCSSSFNFSIEKMLRTWVLAGGGLLAGALLLKTATAAAGGWILGWLLASALP